jgi:thymidylate synthase
MTRSLFDPPGYLQAGDADGAYAETLSRVLDHGEVVTGGNSLSVGAGKNSHELLNYSVVLSNPREKLILNEARRIYLPAAVARFVWMMAGSDRLADIAFYEPKVKSFSDDGIAVPGSSYGQRIMRARPGLNQLEAAIGRLIEDSQSRRAAISVYQPEDAVRSSCDIPCTFGLAYHVRGGKLHATTLMRSNNAFLLLPYNIFEFSLLAEVVAAELNVPLGSLTHYALSMHIYEHEVAKSREVIAGYKHPPILRNDPVPEIPAGSKPLEQIKNLVILEAELRHASEGLTGSNIDEWLARAEAKLDQYWKQFYYLLLLHVVSHKCGLLRSDLVQRSIALEALESVIEEPWKSYLTKGTFQVEGAAASSVGKLISPSYEPAKVIPLRNTRAHRELRDRAEEYEHETGDKISWQQFGLLEERFADQVAARDGKPISKEAFAQAVTELRRDGEE